MGTLARFAISVVLFTTIHAQEKNNSAINSLQSVLYSDQLICDHNRSLDLDVGDTMIYFYDLQNNFNTSYKINGAFRRLTSSYTLDVSRKIIFYVMGYEANITWSISDTMRDTFRNVPNVYLIIVDYSPQRNKGTKSRDFEDSVKNSYYIGKALGRLLAELHYEGIPSQNIHCVGSSLGAQILGYAGDTYMELTWEKVWRITGIDPAGPCFSNSDVKQQLRSGLAGYVEVYHCNAGLLGTSSVLADLDVFLNDAGRTQPHCQVAPGFGEFESAKCSHQSCLTHWARTAEHPGWYRALACDSYENFVTGKCANNEVITAGYYNPGTAFGVFYATTETCSPAKE